MSREIVIVGAARTAVGAFNGAFANIPAHELGAAVITAALQRAKVQPEEVDEVILGQVLTAGEGQNPARQAAMKAGVPKEKTAWGLNQVCGSGLRAVALGLQQIVNEDAKIMVAGGQESMSLSPHVSHLRSGTKMGDVKFIDSMIKDGLTDIFNNYHMGITAENVAAKWQISREEQDKFALGSQNKAEAAQKAGKFADEITPFTVSTRKGNIVVDSDEYIRAGTTLEGLTKLKPAFSEGRHGDGRQCLWPQRRRRGARHHDGGRSACARPDAAGAHRLLGDGRGRSGAHGLGPNSGDPQGARKGRLEGEGSRPRRGQ